MFMTVDKSYKEIMRKVNKVPLAIRAGTQPGLLETLQNNNALLDQIQKCLEAYLESKRVIFPRLVTLSIFSSSTVSSLISKIFENADYKFIILSFSDFTSCLTTSCWKFSPRRETHWPYSHISENALTPFPSWNLVYKLPDLVMEKGRRTVRKKYNTQTTSSL